MSFVAYVGKRQRDPAHVLRVVRSDGTAVHVIEAEDDKADEIARRTHGAVYKDRDRAIRETVARTERA
jgi:endo-alpha-1,4-polygalactosaminidase (GH114 family)